MRYFAIISVNLIVLLHSLGGDLRGVFKRADKICTVYCFDADSFLPQSKAFANVGQLKKVAEELTENGFSYNAQNDTIVLHVQCTDYLVGTYRSPFGKTTYYPLPVSIDAYSAKGECHLKLKDMGYEITTPNANPLIPLIQANDVTAVADLHKKYGACATGMIPDDYIVVIIQGGKVVSASRWSMLLLEYWDRP